MQGIEISCQKDTAPSHFQEQNNRLFPLSLPLLVFGLKSINIREKEEIIGRFQTPPLAPYGVGDRRVSPLSIFHPLPSIFAEKEPKQNFNQSKEQRDGMQLISRFLISLFIVTTLTALFHISFSLTGIIQAVLRNPTSSISFLSFIFSYSKSYSYIFLLHLHFLFSLSSIFNFLSSVFINPTSSISFLFCLFLIRFPFYLVNYLITVTVILLTLIPPTPAFLSHPLNIFFSSLISLKPFYSTHDLLFVFCLSFSLRILIYLNTVTAILIFMPFPPRPLITHILTLHYVVHRHENTERCAHVFLSST